MNVTLKSRLIQSLKLLLEFIPPSKLWRVRKQKPCEFCCSQRKAGVSGCCGWILGRRAGLTCLSAWSLTAEIYSWKWTHQMSCEDSDGIVELLLVCEAGSSSQPDTNQVITVPATLSQIQYEHISIYLYISSMLFLRLRNCASCGTISDIKHKTRRRRNQKHVHLHVERVLHKFASLDKQIQHEISTEVVTITHLFKQNERWIETITWINKKWHFNKTNSGLFSRSA